MKPPKRIDLTPEQIEALMGRIKTVLSDGDYRIIKAIVDTYLFLVQLLEQKTTSIMRLLRMIFGSKSEKTKDVVKDADESETDSDADNPSGSSETEPGKTCDSSDENPDDPGEKEGENKEKKKRKGHGRNGSAAYTGANRIEIPCPRLKAGDPCPECPKGKVYPLSVPKTVVRVEGQAPLQATVYQLERLRCNLCGAVFSAPLPGETASSESEEDRSPPVAEDPGTSEDEPANFPEEFGTGEDEDIRSPEKKAAPPKYDESAGSMIAVLKYGNGFPFYRLSTLQANLGIPLPPATQWDVVEKVADRIRPVFEELEKQAAQGDLLHNDDTVNRILELMDPDKRSEYEHEESERTGVFTTGIISIKDGRRMALFYTGVKHAGENMENLLGQRDEGRSPPIQMCDALSRNSPKGFNTLLANCLSHARRKFVEVVWNFPSHVRAVLLLLKEVYKNDDIAKKQAMSDEERLSFHKEKSGPWMEKLKYYLRGLLEEKKVEPNSGMGQAASYMLRHWEPLTLFLRVPGAPLDNNICERALKMAIRHRKNSLFYKTVHGAYIGDLFMSVIHTCYLNDVNAFEYITVLQKYTSELFKDPARWLPWNYKETLALKTS